MPVKFISNDLIFVVVAVLVFPTILFWSRDKRPQCLSCFFRDVLELNT